MRINKCNERTKGSSKRETRKELNERIQGKTVQKGIHKMLVPENRKNGHIISMYLATCGANASLLGSDEKEIIYLVFGIIDLQNKEVSEPALCFSK